MQLKVKQWDCMEESLQGFFEERYTDFICPLQK